MGAYMRQSAWPEIMAECIEAASCRPFVWGADDCCLFAADVVLAMTGEDYAAEFRGKYSTARGALSALKKYGKGDIEKTLDSKFDRRGFPMRGDVVMAVIDGQQALGICVGTQAAFKGPDGVSFLPLAGLIAWAVD